MSKGNKKEKDDSYKRTEPDKKPLKGMTKKGTDQDPDVVELEQGSAGAQVEAHPKTEPQSDDLRGWPKADGNTQ